MKKIKVIDVKFEGVDDWSRPVFKDVKTSTRYGATDALLPDKRIAPNGTLEEINDFFRNNIHTLCYFGNEFNCEPMGGMPTHYKLNIL